MSPIDLVCLDADDTLWRNEIYFRNVEANVADLLSPWADREAVALRLLDVERANIPRYGFGVKAFALSVIQTALELSNDGISASDVRKILALTNTILDQPVELLDDVVDVVEVLSAQWPLVLITKGDVVHQEAKVMESGLAAHFQSIEIVAHKDETTYARIFAQHNVAAEAVAMVGNSVKSDILPVLQLGGYAIHVPHEHGWALEHAELPNHPRVRHADTFAEVVGVLQRILPLD